ncbi:hypothetical protein K0U00_47475, partial [Paenibacillus sepulcri]|nr:hypothetical protein [Paenibacillus sepulcri]
MESIGAIIEPKKLVFSAQDDKIRSGTGKRSKTKTGTKQGRYVKAVYPKGKTLDIAFDATLRAAAPFQRMRPQKEETAWNISREDIRVKVREKRVGVT